MKQLYIISIITIIILSIILSIIFSIKFNLNSKNLSIYLVSLEKDKDRRDIILKYIQPDIIYAVDGRKLNREKLINDNILYSNSNLKLGEIGCYLSHLNLLEKSMNNNSNYTLILEDDAKIDKKILEKIEKVIKGAPKDFAILSLGYNYIEEFEKYDKISYLHGAHAYVINPKNITSDDIKKFLPISKPFDVILPKYLKTYIVVPKLIELIDFPSNTQGIDS